MARSPQFTVRRVGWSDAGDALRQVRARVFVEEQNVPQELEWDGVDPQCTHVIAESATGDTIGTGRLLPDGHIGRMAVLKPWRRCGVGSAILNELLAAAADAGHASAVLNAQTQAEIFYARFGFEVISGEFMEAGIPHRTMRLALIKSA
jgi:predicted GNAT family N-acyltransferase